MRHWSGGLANSCWLLPPGSTPAPEAIEAVKEAGAAALYRSVAVLRKRRLRISTTHKVCRRKGARESGFRSGGSQIGNQSLVLISRADVVHLRNPKRIESRSSLRTRIREAWSLGLIRVVQIRKCSVCSDHPVWGELVTDAHIPEIAEKGSNRRNHRKVWLLRPAGNRSGPCRKRLVKHVGALLKAVSCGERYVRAEAVLKVDRC